MNQMKQSLCGTQTVTVISVDNNGGVYYEGVSEVEYAAQSKKKTWFFHN